MRLHLRLPGRSRTVLAGVLFLCIVLVPACRNAPATNDSPLVPAPTFSAVPGEGTVLSPAIDIFRAVTAAESFPVALQAARAWREGANWYGIVPYTSMERAFALPLSDDNPSWYFRFGVPEENAEYIVEVRGGEIIGANEITLPGYIEPALGELDPLDAPWNVIDSTEVLEIYRKQPDSMLARAPQMWVDYRLAKSRAEGHPVWALYNAQNIAEPIFAVHAITGEVLPVGRQ